MDTAVNAVHVEMVEYLDSERWLEVRDGHGRLLFKVELHDKQVIPILVLDGTNLEK